MDFIATNRLGRALNAPLFASPRRPVNNARFMFLNEEASRQFYLDWEKGADDIVAAMPPTPASVPTTSRSPT